ncbi:MAG: outer membrane protein assembly factor BamD, partial [Acidobacteriaceae bacterium]
MNRVVTQIVIAGICVAMLPPAFAKKKKKDFDLSKNPLANVNSQQPDKVLFDKAMHALKKGRYDVARLDLQTLLNTYPETEYAMRAKLAIGDTWYREGGSAALTQAENEYKDFITFFPNTPEAAEAQMKVGDIYFQQMQKPDRDPANAEQAEQQYRTMLQEFPDSPLVPRAKQRLREVQEVLAQREFEIGEFYAGRENWAGAIARLQTVADAYPLFSKADQTLITLGDAYATEAAIATHLRLPAKTKAQIVKIYDDRAAAAWDRVVLHYPMAPHVEDAKDRLLAMGRDIPEPTQQEIAESEAEEGSRMNVRLKDRALLMIKQGPSTIRAARVGDPTLKDPPPTLAPQIDQENVNLY